MSIVDYDRHGDSATLWIQNEVYAKEFIRMNPHVMVIQTPQLESINQEEQQQVVDRG